MRARSLGLVLACAIAAACVEQERVPLESLPDREPFVNDGVSAFLENRCGGLDCHGQVGRPLRIYSQNGLRRSSAPDGTRDTRPTTREERLANYDAVVGLEPDAIADCVRTRGDYTDFQLLLKPLDVDGRGVKHKGGPVLRKTDSDPGWACLHGWIAGTLDPQRCKDATF